MVKEFVKELSGARKGYGLFVRLYYRREGDDSTFRGSRTCSNFWFTISAIDSIVCEPREQSISASSSRVYISSVRTMPRFKTMTIACPLLRAPSLTQA